MKKYIVPATIGLILFGIATYFALHHGGDLLGMVPFPPNPPLPPLPPKP